MLEQISTFEVALFPILSLEYVTFIYKIAYKIFILVSTSKQDAF